MIVFISLPLAIFIMAKRFEGYPHWRRWRLYSVLTAILFILFFITFITASAVVDSGAVSVAPVGLLQRITIIIGWSWTSLLAFQLGSKL